MKLIVHIGTPKTGTTTLQDTLAASRIQLMEAGILYPTSKESGHHALGLLLTYDRPPRNFVQDNSRSPEDLLRLAEEELERIEAQISEHKPSRVVLSTENLFRSVPSARAKAFADRLRRITPDIQLVCYLRDPVAYYLSEAGQLLKTQHIVPPVKAPPYEHVLKQFLAELPVAVHRYDRRTLAQGSICADFASHYLPGVALADLGERNPSLSAEGIDILCSFRRAAFAAAPDLFRPGRFRPETSRMLKLLLAAETEVGTARSLTAQPAVAKAIRSMFTSQEAFLMNSFGIGFPAPEGELPDGPRPSGPLNLAQPSDVYVVDPVRRERMVNALLWQLSIMKGGGKQPPDAKPANSATDASQRREAEPATSAPARPSKRAAAGSRKR